jgi:hypothetical protein
VNDLTIERPTSTSRRSDGARLAAEVLRVEDVAPRDRDQMHELMRRYFAGVDRDAFDRDLAEKAWVVVLRDAAAGRVRGFSTLMRIDADTEAGPVAGLFSGDTIVEREYWGEAALARVWSRHAFRVAESIRDRRVFWFLISSGYKTYRFLPVFFREFYPTYVRPTPAAVRAALTALAGAKFPDEFDARSGIVRPRRPAPLRAGIADADARRLVDPHVAFFVAANPGHARGDELVCLTELTRRNLTPAGRRMAGGGAEEP